MKTKTVPEKSQQRPRATPTSGRHAKMPTQVYKVVGPKPTKRERTSDESSHPHSEPRGEDKDPPVPEGKTEIREPMEPDSPPEHEERTVRAARPPREAKIPHRSEKRADKKAAWIGRSISEDRAKELGDRDARRSKEAEIRAKEIHEKEEKENAYKELVAKDRRYLDYCPFHFTRGACINDKCKKDHGPIDDFLVRMIEAKLADAEPDDLSEGEEEGELPSHLRPTPVQTHFVEDYVPGLRRRKPHEGVVLEEREDGMEPAESKHKFGTWTVPPRIPKGTEAAPVNANKNAFSGLPKGDQPKDMPHDIKWGKYRITNAQYYCAYATAIILIFLGVFLHFWTTGALGSRWNWEDRGGPFTMPPPPKKHERSVDLNDGFEIPTDIPFDYDEHGRIRPVSNIDTGLIWSAYMLAWCVLLIFVILATFQPLKYRNVITFKRLIFMDAHPDLRPDLNALSAMKHPYPLIVEYEYERFDVSVPLEIGGYRVALPCFDHPPKQTLTVSWELFTQIANSRFIGFHKDDHDSFVALHRATAREQFTNKDRYGKIFGEFVEEHTIMLTWGLHCEFKETTDWWDFPRAPE